MRILTMRREITGDTGAWQDRELWAAAYLPPLSRGHYVRSEISVFLLPKRPTAVVGGGASANTKCWSSRTWPQMDGNLPAYRWVLWIYFLFRRAETLQMLDPWVPEF